MPTASWVVAKPNSDLDDNASYEWHEIEQMAKDNGVKKALIPIANKRQLLEASGDIMEHLNPVFYGDPKTAAFKTLGMN